MDVLIVFIILGVIGAFAWPILLMTLGAAVVRRAMTQQRQLFQELEGIGYKAQQGAPLSNDDIARFQLLAQMMQTQAAAGRLDSMTQNKIALHYGNVNNQLASAGLPPISPL